MPIGKLLAGIAAAGVVAIFFWLPAIIPTIHYQALFKAEDAARAGYTWPAQGLRWLATDVFPSRHFCGNAIRSERLRLVLIDTDILRHTQSPEAATRFLLPHVLLADETIVADRAIELLSERHSAAGLRELGQGALASLRHVGPEPYDYSVRILDIDVPFKHFSSGESPQDALAQTPLVSLLLGSPPTPEQLPAS